MHRSTRQCGARSGSPQLYGTGPTRRRSTCEKDRARAEMGHKQSKRDRARERRWNEETLHHKRVRQRRSLTDTRTTLCSLSETLQTTALPSLPQYLVPQHLAATRYTRLQRISTCIFPDILLREAESAHAYSSYYLLFGDHCSFDPLLKLHNQHKNTMVTDCI